MFEGSTVLGDKYNPKQSDTTQQLVPPADGGALGGFWGGCEGRSGSHRAGLVQKQPYCGGKKAPTYEWRQERGLRLRTRLCGGRVDRG